MYGAPSLQVTSHDDLKLLDEWLDDAEELDIFATLDASTSMRRHARLLKAPVMRRCRDSRTRS